MPGRAVVTGAAFSLYAVGTVGAFLEGAVYPGHETAAGAADFAGLSICYADTRYPLVRGWPVSAILAQLGQLEERSGAGPVPCCGACGRRQSRSALTAGP